MKCVLCDNRFSTLLFVGIGHANLSTNTGLMKAHPVCTDCVNDPEHRTRKAKLHFHYASHTDIAVAAAQLLDLKSQAGEDLSL